VAWIGHTRIPLLLDAAYVARAIPTGSARHWSYAFAAPPLRAPLLGIFALLAEWQALLDPATESGVAQLKLAWWHEEMLRLVEGAAVHPISLYLASQPAAAAAHFKMLPPAVRAAMLEISGAPLELGAQLAAHSAALIAGPLRVASLIASAQTDAAALEQSTQALAVALYLARALQHYRREAKSGRVPFAVDELLLAGVENSDLLAQQPAPHLQKYLENLRRRADDHYMDVARDTPPAARPLLRHLLVLAALGHKHLGTPLTGDHSRFAALKDMLLAWTTARRALT
jgi:15-cis-phytoene synthase